MTRTDHNVWPIFLYDDARAARGWLVSVGFEEGVVVPGDADGEIRHSEMLWPEGGRVAVASRSAVGDHHHGLGSCYVVTAELEAVHDRAMAQGLTVADPLKETDYGSRDVALTDPEGNTWFFGTYAGEDG